MRSMQMLYKNAPEIKPAVIQGMSEVMMEMMGPEAIELGIMDVIDPVQMK